MDYTNIYDRFTRAFIDRLATDSDYIESISSDNIEFQYRYKILTVGIGTDFVSVGAENNDIGTVFYAIAETVTWGTGGELQRGFKPYEIINNNIIIAQTHLASYASAVGASYSETDTIIEATLLYTLFILYSNNQKEEGGLDEFNNCVNILAAEWGNGIRDIMIPEEANGIETDIPYTAQATITLPDWENDIDVDYIKQIQNQ